MNAVNLNPGWSGAIERLEQAATEAEVHQADQELANELREAANVLRNADRPTTLSAALALGATPRPIPSTTARGSESALVATDPDAPAGASLVGPDGEKLTDDPVAARKSAEQSREDGKPDSEAAAKAKAAQTSSERVQAKGGTASAKGSLQPPKTTAKK